MRNSKQLVREERKSPFLFYCIVSVAIFYLSLFVFNSPVEAAATEGNEFDLAQEIEIETVFIDGRGLTTDEIELKLEEAIEENTSATTNSVQARSAQTRALTVVTAGVVRIGTGDVCQVYLHWSGSSPINVWRMSRMEIKSNSLLFPDTYDVITNFYSDVVGAPHGSVYVDTVVIPASQDSVKISASGLQANYMLSGWRSAVVKNGTAVIN